MARCIVGMAGILALAMNPVFAQETGPVGAAFVEAPEQSRGACFAGTIEAAMDCAQAQCLATDGVRGEDCTPVRWCFPAGWSADVYKVTSEGFQWHDYLCGWDSRERLEAAVALTCDANLAECLLNRIWDDSGNEIDPTD